MAIGNGSGFETTSLGVLSAPGVSVSEETAGGSVTFQLRVTGISGTIVVRFEGNFDDAPADFGNLNGVSDTTITANGTYLYALSLMPVKFVRLRYVSGTGSVAVAVGAA